MHSVEAAQPFQAEALDSPLRLLPRLGLVLPVVGLEELQPPHFLVPLLPLLHRSPPSPPLVVVVGINLAVEWVVVVVALILTRAEGVLLPESHLLLKVREGELS